MDDTRDYIEQTRSRAADFTGKDLSPQEMATEFAKWDVVTRVDALQAMSAEKGELTLSQAAEQFSYESKLRNMHKKLLKVGR